MSQKVRISQCMIVKNEERNIGRALSWGKEILCEQIVVDTGSTDNTVKIAEEMGAKVYHFDWIGDFAAAKNFAISKARGDWIAFLDADEYYPAEDAKKLYALLEQLQDQPQVRTRCMIRSALLELDDEGRVFSTACQNRVFSNSPHIRYVNRIHEKLHYDGPGQLVSINMEKTLSIYHTGYSASAFQKTDKAGRNIKLLKEALEEEPENGELWSYLGDSLYAAEKYDEAESAFEMSLEKPAKEMSEERRIMAYSGLMRIIGLKDLPDGEERLRGMQKKAREEHRDSPDLDYWMGMWMYRHQKNEEARSFLEAALQNLEGYRGAASLMVTGSLGTVYGMLTYICLKLEDRPSAVRYGVLALRLDRYMDTALEAILSLLRDEPGQLDDPEATCCFLEKLYDFTQIRDRLFVMKAAKKVDFDSLYDRLYGQMDPKEQAWLDARPRPACPLEPEEAKERYPEIPCVNETDLHFAWLMEEVKKKTEGELLAQCKEKLFEIRKKDEDQYESILRFYKRYPFWGKLQPGSGEGENEYEVLETRVRSVKEHVEDFVWLYGRLEDNRSRRTLHAILDNWLYFGREALARERENGCMYFDTDLIPDGSGMVFVDLGAYTGDSTLDFIRTYGEGYGRIYCYEITPESVEGLKRAARFYHDIDIRPKAACETCGVRYVKRNQDQGTNQVDETGDLPVEAAALDEEIKEPISFIKMDIEGGEKGAILGSRGHIQKEHPKLAVSIYHGYEDIWKIPRMIAQMNPDYRFYMRNYGGNLIPAEFILYAV